jgi:hypothetical protein
MISEDDEWSLTTLLCDAAQVADGKLFILGGGWTLTGPGPFVHGLAMKLEVPWGQANRKHTIEASLLDEDGQPVVMGDPPQAVSFETEFEVGRPPGIVEGTRLDLPFAVNLGAMELPPGRGYAWSIRVSGVERGRARFRVRS